MFHFYLMNSHFYLSNNLNVGLQFNLYLIYKKQYKGCLYKYLFKVFNSKITIPMYIFPDVFPIANKLNNLNNSFYV